LKRFLMPLKVVGAIVVLLLVFLLVLSSVSSGDLPGSTAEYILLPDVAHPVAPLVKVEGAHPAKGGTVYFVDVVERRASTLEELFPWLRPHATLVPASEIVPPGSTSSAVRLAELQQMSISQRVAAAVALRRLGYHVVVHANGVIVNAVDLGTHAVGTLQPSDIIVAVDGKPTPTLAKLRGVLSATKPGDVVALRVERGPKNLTLHIRTVNDGGRAIVGFEPAQAAQIKLPIRVSIDAGGIGGPSAGLAFALEVMEMLGHNVVHGYNVAATGEMELDGSIGPIGGVKQKTYGVRQAGADVFLVPAGDNAATARHYAGPLRIIPVRTFAQALHALATLPPKR
jgi:PDZ domain-containing protein